MSKNIIPVSAAELDGGKLVLKNGEAIQKKVDSFIKENSHFLVGPLTADTFKAAKDERANINALVKQFKAYRIAKVKAFTEGFTDGVKKFEEQLEEVEKKQKELVDEYQAENAIGRFKNSELKPIVLTVSTTNADVAEKIKAYANSLGASVKSED